MGPCAGALVGTLIYVLMVEIHHPPDVSDALTSYQEDTELAGGKTGQELEEVETEKKRET